MDELNFECLKNKIYKYNRLCIKYDVGLNRCWYKAHPLYHSKRVYDLPEKYEMMSLAEYHNFWIDEVFVHLEFSFKKLNRGVNEE